MSRVVLASASTAFEERLREALKGLDGDSPQDELLLRLEDPQVVTELSKGTQVVVLGPGISADSALRLAQELDRGHPDISVVLIAESSPSLLEQALSAGVRGVLAPDSPAEQLRDALERAFATASRRAATVPDTAPTSNGSARVITVLSPKGGSGRTMIASNLAVLLARSAREQVALVDLDLQFPDAANALFLTPEQTIADAAHSLSTLDSTTLKVFLSRHSSGLYVLCGPSTPAEAEDVTPDQVSQLIELLTSEFHLVVVDTSAGLTEPTLAALDLSTDLVLICDMSVASVRGLQKTVEALDDLGMTGPARHFALNRADSRVGLDLEDVASTVGMTIDIEIPSSRSVTVSLNQGSPLVESDERSPVSSSLAKLAGRFADLVVARRNGLLRRRNGR
ncbi:MAG: CpaE family protein [Acidimicrobiia bacterium]